MHRSCSLAEIIGVIALVPLVLFIRALAQRAPDTAGSRRLMTAAVLADAALFASLALLAMVAIAGQMGWFRWFGIAVAALCLARAVASPLGLTALDAVAPFAFLIFVVTLGAWMLRTRPSRV
jgi:hypothetical protein